MNAGHCKDDIVQKTGQKIRVHYELKNIQTFLGACEIFNRVSIILKCLEEMLKEKKKEIWPSPMTNPLYQQKTRKPKDNTQTPPKTSILQRLRTDLGRSVGVTSHRFTGTQPSH